MGLTPAKALAQVRAQTTENTTNFLTDTVIYSWLWQSEIELADFAGLNQNVDTSITTVAATREYTIPAGTLQIYRLLYDSVKLKKIDFTELDAFEGSAYGGVVTSGQPQYYYEFGGKIGFSAIPNAAKTVTIYRAKEPTEITSASTAFSIPSEYAHYLLDYCMYRYYAMDGVKDLAGFHNELWESNKRKGKAQWLKRAGADRYYNVKNEDTFQQTDYGII